MGNRIVFGNHPPQQGEQVFVVNNDELQTRVFWSQPLTQTTRSEVVRQLRGMADKIERMELPNVHV
jgi:hypothetical protein